MLSTAAPFLAIMDADLQHDEQILPHMLYMLKTHNLDVVVGSRNVAGGSMGKLPLGGSPSAPWVVASALPFAAAKSPTR